MGIIKYFIEKKKFDLNFADKLNSTPAHDAARYLGDNFEIKS